MHPERLRVEYLENPPGIDELLPRFFWVMSDDRRGAGHRLPGGGVAITVSAAILEIHAHGAVRNHCAVEDGRNVVDVGGWIGGGGWRSGTRDGEGVGLDHFAITRSHCGDDDIGPHGQGPRRTGHACGDGNIVDGDGGLGNLHPRGEGDGGYGIGHGSGIGEDARVERR